MQKNILEDIKPLTSSGRRTTKHEADDNDSYEVPVHISETNNRGPVRYERPPIRTGEHKRGIWILALFAIILLIGALSLVFAGATITVTPKSQKVVLDDTFTAKSTGSDASLTFDVIGLEDSVTEEVAASGTKEVLTKAAGRVVIYNETAQSQILKIETRLSNKDGKIYKTDTAVTVPAQRTVSGKKVPGSVEVGVHADVAGEEYNIPLSDFKIVGFKGTPKYNTIYARGKTPIAGGSKGTEAQLDEEERKALLSLMTAALREKLLLKVKAQTPSDFIHYEDGIFFTPNQTLRTISSAEGKATVELGGTMAVILFNEEKLGRALAMKAPGYESGTDVTFSGIKNLAFVLNNRSLIAPKETKEISFKLNGEGVVVWDIDAEALRDSFIGKKRRDINSILAEFPAVESAQAPISPFWKSTYPNDRKDIDVIIRDVAVTSID